MTLDLNPYLEKIKKDNFCREIRNEIVEAFEKIDETINNNNMQDLNDFQKKEDKTLDTDDKKVIGAINEVYSKCQAIEESLESLELPLTTSKVISKNLINTTMFENLSVDEFFENYESGNLIIPVIEETFEIGQAYNTEVLFTDGTSDASGDFFFQFQKNGTTVFSRYTFNLTDTIDSAKLIFNKTSFLANHAGKIFSHIQVCKKASGQSYPTYEQYAEKKDYTTFVRSSDLEKLQLQNLSPFFYPKKVKIVAHRGGESKYTENSIGAFIEGCKDGYDFIETDIWQTSDGELICMHDQTLDRTSNATGDVMQMTLSEIQEKKLKDGSTIPTLKEFLLICKKYGKVPVIEIKNINQDWNKLSQELSYVAMEDSAIILCASIDNLNSIRKVLPRVHCSYLMYETDSITKEILNELKNISNTSLNTNCNLTEADIKLCHQYNVLIGKWTIDDVDVANNLIDIEIDFITTNNSNILSRDTYSRKEIDTQFEKIVEDIAGKKEEEIISPTGVFIGDSLTNWAGGDDNSGGFLTVVHNKTGLRTTNRGLAGAWWQTGDNQTQCAVNRVDYIIANNEKFDLYCFIMGSNAGSNIDTGETSEDTTTMCGAIRYCMETLKAYDPTGQILVCLPPQRAEGNANQLLVNEVIKKIVEDEYSVRTFDIYRHSGIVPNTTIANVGYLSDGLHLGENGYTALGNSLASEVKYMLCL